jgi:hypothetical protein
MRPARPLAVAALAALAAGCDESDVVSVRIRLKEDLSGTIVTTSLLVPADAGPVERSSNGVTWSDRVNVVGAAGGFENLSALALGDILFACGVLAGGACYLQVTLPRGPDARWPKTFVPLADVEQRRLGPIFDPSGRAKGIGSNLKLWIELPAPALAHGLVPSATGARQSVEGNEASLVVPVDTARIGGRPLVWQITWKP